MNYPINILPNYAYRLIDCDISHLTLIRYFKVIDNDDYIEKDTGKIKQIYIANPTQQISDCSTNLLSVFQIEDIYISLTTIGNSVYNQYCNPDEEVETPLFEHHFILDKHRKYFYINISNINNQLIPYELENETFYCKCFIVHTPMKWNFWHFSIRWKTHDDKWLHDFDNNKFKKGWVKRLSNLAKSFIANFAKIEIPEFCIIDENNYKK